MIYGPLSHTAIPTSLTDVIVLGAVRHDAREFAFDMLKLIRAPPGVIGIVAGQKASNDPAHAGI